MNYLGKLLPDDCIAALTWNDITNDIFNYQNDANLLQGLFGGIRNFFQGITRPRGNR